jgi:hypothetical protein
MDYQQGKVVASRDDQKIDELLYNLDDIARTYDEWDFGLPMDSDGEQMKLMRQAVLQWLETL